MTAPALAVLMIALLPGTDNPPGEAQTQPEPAVKAAPADFSQPRQTLQTLARAFQAEDLEAVKNCFAFTGPAWHSDSVALFLRQAVLQHRYGKLMVTRFGNEARELLGNQPQLDVVLTDWVQKTTDADFTITGQEAVYSGSQELPFTCSCFSKKGTDWKVDAFHSEKLQRLEAKDLERLEQKVREEDRVFQVTAERLEFFIREIEQGKFRSAWEVENALEEAHEAGEAKLEMVLRREGPARLKGTASAEVEETLMAAMEKALREKFHTLAQSDEHPSPKAAAEHAPEAKGN